jgi:hypothetical protein
MLKLLVQGENRSCSHRLWPCLILDKDCPRQDYDWINCMLAIDNEAHSLLKRNFRPFEKCGHRQLSLQLENPLLKMANVQLASETLLIA